MLFRNSLQPITMPLGTKGVCGTSTSAIYRPSVQRLAASFVGIVFGGHAVVVLRHQTQAVGTQSADRNHNAHNLSCWQQNNTTFPPFASLQTLWGCQQSGQQPSLAQPSHQPSPPQSSPISPAQPASPAQPCQPAPPQPSLANQPAQAGSLSESPPAATLA